MKNQDQEGVDKEKRSFLKKIAAGALAGALALSPVTSSLTIDSEDVKREGGDPAYHDSDFKHVNYSTGMSQWHEDLSGEETNRWQLEADEEFELRRLDVTKQGGESESDFSVTVEGEGSGELATNTAGEDPETSPTTSISGDQIIVTVENQSAEEVVAAITVVGIIKPI